MSKNRSFTKTPILLNGFLQPNWPSPYPVQNKSANNPQEYSVGLVGGLEDQVRIEQPGWTNEKAKGCTQSWIYNIWYLLNTSFTKPIFVGKLTLILPSFGTNQLRIWSWTCFVSWGSIIHSTTSLNRSIHLLHVKFPKAGVLLKPYFTNWLFAAQLT